MAQARVQQRGPRRRPPARVYWVRRLVVLGTALLLVFAVGRLLNGSSDGSDPGPPEARAVEAGAAVVASSDPATTSSEPTITMPQGTKKPRKSRPPKPSPTPLAQPSGPCSPEDVVVTPEVRNPVGGSDVVIALALRTQLSPACVFDVSSRTVTMNITSGSDAIWSTRQCPGAMPTTSVVARQDLATYVFVTWNGKRSDATCSRLTGWAYPGWYHVHVAALGGEPADEQFELARPQPTTVTSTVTPDPTKSPKGPKGR